MSEVLARVFGFEALLAATDRAARGRRNQPEVAAFVMDVERNVLALAEVLARPADDLFGWRPGVGRVRVVRDPKPRVITVIPFVDRVVHHALFAEIAPALERYAIADTFACREGKGTHRALRRCRAFARRTAWCWKADISKYFASIPHDRLIALLRRRAIHPDLLARVELIVRSPQPGLGAGKGIPVGSLSSQHLANLYLGALDHHVKDDLGVRRYLRYVGLALGGLCRGTDPAGGQRLALVRGTEHHHGRPRALGLAAGHHQGARR